MVEYLTLNGTAVRLSAFDRRTAAVGEGVDRDKVSLVVVLRGAAAHRAFFALLSERPLRVELPDGPAFVALDRATHTVAGAGPAALYRHDLTLRQLPPDG